MKSAFGSMKNVMHHINNRLSELCGLLLMVMVLLLSIDVVGRGVGSAIHGLATLSVYVLLAAVYLGMSRSEEYDEHASIDFLPMQLPPKGRKFNAIIVNALKLFAISLLFYASVGSFFDVYISRESFADVIRIPMWPSKLAVVIGLFFFVIQIFIKLLDSFIDFFSPTDK